MGSSESINSISSSIKQARANSLANYPQGYPGHGARQEETEYYGIPFMLQRPQGLPSSQPTSPTHPPGHRHSSGQPSYSSLPASYSANGKSRQPKLFAADIAEDLNGSAASLISNGSSVYSSQEERTAADILKLQKELVEEHNKVVNLTTQLSTNAHVVSAFEQSLANMTARLHQITKTAEQKDSEVILNYPTQLHPETIRNLRSPNYDARSHVFVKRELTRVFANNRPTEGKRARWPPLMLY